jgi:hypothetical protein
MPAPRRRFTISHELGHFLIAAHRGDKRCSAKDMYENGRETHHQKEEAQANRFAAGLLMPALVRRSDRRTGETRPLQPPNFGIDLRRQPRGRRQPVCRTHSRGMRFRLHQRRAHPILPPSRAFPILIVRRGEQAPLPPCLATNNGARRRRRTGCC